MPGSRLACFAWLALLLGSGVSPLRASELDECGRLLDSGRYEECIRLADRAIRSHRYGEDWPLLKAQAERALGLYEASRQTLESGLARYPWSIRLRWLAADVLRLVDQPQRAAQMLREIEQRASASPWRYTDAENLVDLGRSALQMGADPRDVLEGFFERARRAQPRLRAAYLAIADLALAKHDAALAGEVLQEAAQRFPHDAEILYRIAQAEAATARDRSDAALAAALEANPRHVPSLLLLANRSIDAEDFESATALLRRALAVNPRHPEAYALLAVIAHLTNDPKGAEAFRTAALQSWSTNPQVDHVIGRELSRHYRFAEGAAAQRRALAFAPDYVPARMQLAQDLLRLGEEAPGWLHAETAFRADEYDVIAYNLLELRDRLEQFTTLDSEHFRIRMQAQEAAVYGKRVVDLLERAHASLCAKYGLDFGGRVTVEIFPQPHDFAVRTFGMPAVSGYLGVCFGNVITANSPVSSREHPTNWESVLWHEFAHVVTLRLTRNRIPRWLSEGISVYEERQADPTWGQSMNPRYRQMILDGELTPIGSLSAAFHAPKSGFHLQWAYYESSLVVEFLVGRYGFDALKSVLRDLGAGLPIEEALPRHTAPWPQLEHAFADFARRRAEQLAPQADWETVDVKALAADDGEALREWLDEHPRSVPALVQLAVQRAEEEQTTEAIALLERAVRLYPAQTGPDSPYRLLARLYERSGQAAEQRRVLETLCRFDAHAVEPRLRLIELQEQSGDWSAVQQTAEALLAVDPMIPEAWRALARAAERTGNDDRLIDACRALLALNTDDAADWHFRLARALHRRGDPAAREHVLLALERAPRFREALALLLAMKRSKDGSKDNNTGLPDTLEPQSRAESD